MSLHQQVQLVAALFCLRQEGRVGHVDLETALVFGHPARVGPAGLTAAADLLALVATRHAFDDTILEERPPFFWLAEISSNRLDAYFTRMAPSTLVNFGAEAAEGVTFQNSHRFNELGLGRSLTGTYEQAGDVARVLAEFYTVPGLRLAGVGTDDFIAGVRSGLIHDVSVGFYGGQFRCSLCGRDMLRDWDCPHVPGMLYDVRDPLDNVTGQEMAIAWVEDAHLAEVSAVYDGATPGAAILKAQQEAEAGRLRAGQVQLLEARYRIRLPAARMVTAGVDVKLQRSETEAMEPTIEELTSEVERLRPLADEAERLRPLIGEVERLRPLVDEVRSLRPLAGEVERLRLLVAEVDRLRTVADEVEHLRPLVAEVERLRPLADDGALYRADLVAEALAEGVRASGTHFQVEMYQTLLAAAPLATIKQMRDDWRALGDRIFTGGRKTTDEEQAPAREPVTMARAYQG